MNVLMIDIGGSNVKMMVDGNEEMPDFPIRRKAGWEAGDTADAEFCATAQKAVSSPRRHPRTQPSVVRRN